jgi:hypothetical protein
MAATDEVSVTLHNLQTQGPFRWGGEEERWIEWQFEVMQWSRRHDKRMLEYMSKSADQTAEVDWDDMTEEIQGLAGKLMSDLAMRTTDRARRVLMTMEDQGNGFEAWRRLTELGQGGGRLRKVGLKSDPPD